MSTDVARSHSDDGGGKGKRKPNLGDRAAGRLNTRDKTRNLSLKEITNTKGPVPIQFELRDKQTVMPLGDHAAHWSSYIGETQFDLRPHMKSPDWTEINAGIQQHLQKAYNTNKAAFKAQHWVIDPTTWTYNVEKIRRERPENAQNRQNRAKSTVISRQGSRSLARLRDEMRQTSTTQEYPSLIDTFFVAHTVNGEFLRDEDRRIYEEMRRLEAMGTYTDDEINRLARGGKQRGHIAGVGRVLPARATASPKENVPPLHLILDWNICGTHLFAGDYCWERNPLRAFPSDYSPATSHRGKSSPATSRRGKPGFVAGKST
nr:F-box domain, leucine-rich repeat domain, L domain-like protein [Tanacetum cinerariifolium]